MKKIFTKSDPKSRFLIALILLNILLRIILWIAFDPITGQDTSGYERLAVSIKTGDFSDYPGDRTPVFPLVMVLNNLNYSSIVITQFIMGIIISLLLFYSLIHLKVRPVFAFIGGALYCLHIPLVMREFYIATEATAIFFTCLLFFLIVLYHTGKQKKILMVFLIGVVISLLTLTRPASLVLIPFVILLMIIFERVKDKKWNIRGIIISGFTYFIPVLILVGGWCQFNKVKYGQFTLTTFTGYSLVNSTGNLMVHAPDKYEPYKSLYLESHHAMIQKTGKYYNAVHDCRDTLMEVTGLNFWELSAKWKEIAIEVIKDQPAQFAGESARSFIRNWKPMGFYKSDNHFLLRIRQLEQIMVVLATVLFFLIPIILFFTRRKKPFSMPEQFLIGHIFLMALGISGISALVEYGDPRFSLPYLPLIFILVLFFYIRLISLVWPGKEKRRVSQ